MKNIRKFKLSTGSIISFCLSVLLCSTLAVVTIQNKQNIEKMKMEQLIVEKSNAIKENISKMLYKTYTLAVFVRQNNGEIHDFNAIASTIVDHPAIMNVLLAPDGVVSYVYPLEGNEAVIGLDFFSEGKGNLEAIKAKELGDLVFGGPFELVQGGQALVGRLPIYLTDDQNIHNDHDFWGLASITLSYPEILDSVNLDSLKLHGFSYELWRINPDTNDKQIIAFSNNSQSKKAVFVEKRIPILNAEWYFRISPVRKWYQYFEAWLIIIVSLCISVMISLIIQNNFSLKSMQKELENMIITDSLLGIPNRKGLFQSLNALIQKNLSFHLYYIDLNRFKEINDTYGHHVGDAVLKEFSTRMRKHTHNDFIFARIGGDEFIVVYPHPDNKSTNPDIIQNSLEYFWNELDKEFQSPVSLQHNQKICISFSRGFSVFPTDGQTIDDLINIADMKMYEHKRKR